MCEKTLAKLPSMTADERCQLRSNCERAIARSKDGLLVQEARRVLHELEVVEAREQAFLARLSLSRKVEYAFRRLPASDHERAVIVSVAAPRRPSLTNVPPRRGRYDSRFMSVFNTDAYETAVALEQIYARRRHLLTALGDFAENDDDADTHRGGQENDDCPLTTLDPASGHVCFRPEVLAAFVTLGHVSTAAEKIMPLVSPYAVNVVTL